MDPTLLVKGFGGNCGGLLKKISHPDSMDRGVENIYPFLNRTE